MKKENRWIIWMCAAVLGLALIGVFGAHYRGLRPFVTVESGDTLPALASETDRYSRDYGTLPTGLHLVRVVHNGINTPELVWVRDTVAPTANAKELTIAYGSTVTPDRLVSNIRDAGIVAVSFSEPFEFDRIGDFPVEILLKDASGNRTSVASVLHIRATVDEIALEAGAATPKAEAFLLDGVQAEPITAIDDEMLHHVGTYPVRFVLQNGQTAESKLVVSDTVPPQGESTFLWVQPEEPFLPEQLVDRAADETTVRFAFLEEPDVSVMHAQTVTVRMTDEGGNTTDVVSTLAISHVAPITVEASREPLNEEALFGTNVVLDEPFLPDTPGLYSVPVTVDGASDFALITVVDTTPPVVLRADTALYTLHPMEADAVFSADDLSPVTFTWEREPDWDTAGEQTAAVVAVDRYDNKTRLETTLTLEADTEAPVLYGVINRTAYVGEPIAYLAEVYAEDAVDGRTAVSVQSEVEPDKAGSYTVTYSSEDRSGNRVSISCKFKLVNATVTEEEVKQLAKAVLDGIVTDDMVRAEQLKAVFQYVRSHVKYVGNSDKSDWRKEAVRGFKTGKGDCFTFYAVTRALLDELGVDYMSLTRKGGSTRHYWVIVSIGTGWYHFDPTLAPRHKHQCFMWTNKQCQVKPYFWRYEQSSYPDIATEPFDYDAVVQMEHDGLLP